MSADTRGPGATGASTGGFAQAYLVAFGCRRLCGVVDGASSGTFQNGFGTRLGPRRWRHAHSVDWRSRPRLENQLTSWSRFRTGSWPRLRCSYEIVTGP